MRNEVTVVVPTYNERENIGILVEALLAHDVAVLIVDDSSPDGTGEIADSLALDPRVSVLHRPTKEGLGPAYAAGFARALSDEARIVVQMDADLSHDPAAVPELVAAIESGAELAIGSRYIRGGSTPGWPSWRRWLSRAGNGYARTVLGVPVADMTGGFRAWNASALAAVDAESCGASGYAFQVETAYRTLTSGRVVVEVPIRFVDRRFGKSKMGLHIVWEAMWLVTRWGLRRFTGAVRSRA